MATVLGIFLSLVSSSCVPDVHSSFLSDPAILQDEAITAAFAQVQQNLSSLFATTSSDGLSFAVVHASGPGLAFSFNHGRLRMNDSSSPDITSDSIFRIISVSKTLAAFSALALENVSRTISAGDPTIQPLSLDTPVRNVLPSFNLPENDWLNGGSEITLAMLGTHSSGLTREGYSTDYNMVAAQGQANADYIGAEWASVTPDEVLQYLSGRNLMFAPGQRAAYSNAGFAVLGAAISSYRNSLLGLDEPWTDYVQNDIFGPLGMTRSFFGPPPTPDLRDQLAVPGVSNWADLVLDGYNPAGGMSSSASDLAAYLHQAWLAPTPRLISPTQRRQALQPRIALPDGTQQVGFGWEIPLVTTPDKTYFVYGKSGNGGGYQAWVDVVPNLGYGLVVLSQASGEPNKTRIRPTAIRDSVHEILIPAFEAALTNLMARRFAGNYTVATDSGLIADEVATTGTNSTATGPQSYGLLEVQDGSMFLRTLIVNGTDALEGIDKLGWGANATSGGRFFSVPGVGSGLNPSDAVGDAAQLAPGGEGVTIWRAIPELDECDWFDFGGYTDQNGWPLSQVAIVEKGSGAVELHYPPFDIVLTRSEPV